MITSPCLIEFPKIGNPKLGYISTAEKETLPFEITRIYWTYYTPEDVERGGHSHVDLQQILVAVAGIIIVNTETLDGIKSTFILDSPNKGLHLPKLCWREMKYAHNSVQMCLASLEYNGENDYIRDYAEFEKLKNYYTVENICL